MGSENPWSWREVIWLWERLQIAVFQRKYIHVVGARTEEKGVAEFKVKK